MEIELKRRTRVFALGIIAMVDQLPRSKAADVIGKQLLRSATSVGANYRAACRARSPADFLSKITIVEEESDESVYWLDLLLEAHLVDPDVLDPLRREGNELTAIFTASGKTVKRRLRQSAIQNPKSAI